MKIAPSLFLEALITTARTFGVRGSVLRSVHEVRRHSGMFRLTPRWTASVSSNRKSPFAVDGPLLTAITDKAVAADRAARVLDGKFEAHRWTWRVLPSTSELWLDHPFTGQHWPSDKGWWHAPHLDPELGDIKELWEPARFAWAYDLVRYFLISGDDRYAAAFHTHLRNFANSSPPFRGPHWSCGQETAIRAVALLYAEANLSPAPSSVPDAMARLSGLLMASGERIADAIGYAVSQRNNHGISEAAGLIALGVRFIGVHPEAPGWLVTGKRIIERLVLEQFETDGWYIQHSFNYMRVALDQCIVAERALRSIGERFSDPVRRRLGAAFDLLLAVVDPITGGVPNHGSNDGAFVHPVTLAGFSDFRPILTALAAMLPRALPTNVRVDTESLAWLGLSPPPAADAIVDGIHMGDSGWASARIARNSVFLRAGAYRSRPGHLDALHVDVRIGGREIVVDPGTFAYNALPPWRNGLLSARVHNGPLLDDAEPGIRGPRFLWYRWPFAKLGRTAIGKGDITIVAEIPGRVQRTVCLNSTGVVVKDEVLSANATNIRVGWLLHPDADPTAICVEGGADVRVAVEGDTAGWYSPTYGVRLASRVISSVRRAAQGVTIVTKISKGL